jgi:hypothetical protein
MVTRAREAAYSGDNRSEGPCIDILRMYAKLQLPRHKYQPNAPTKNWSLGYKTFLNLLLIVEPCPVTFYQRASV